LATGNDRRGNVSRAIDLVRDDLLPKIKGRVLIKPNFVSTDNQLAATHVDVIRAILDLVVPAGPDEIVVAEAAGPGNTAEGYANYGYDKLPDEYPVKLIDLGELTEWQPIHLLDANQNLVEAQICTYAVETDCRISAAVMKTHDTAICTLSMKNMMGALARADRGKMHGKSEHIPEPEIVGSVRVMNRNIVRLNRLLLPHIAVIDGFEGMQGDGPCAGDPVHVGAVVVGADPVAADAVAAKVMGFEPLDVGFIFYANEIGMGIGDLSRIEPCGDPFEASITPFQPHPRYEAQKLWRVDPPWLLD